MEPSNHHPKTGEDEFLTKPTGFRGMNTQTVGFRAPCLVYYANDYTAVGAVPLLFGVPLLFRSDRSLPELGFFGVYKRTNVRKGETAKPPSGQEDDVLVGGASTDMLFFL